MGASTLAVHAGVSPCPVTGAILTPIYQSTTFVQPSIDGCACFYQCFYTYGFMYWMVDE
jgi:O-acetylhomoserine/O-acetylserine sulfhydrylase-like pyridoxal-dependent enzyme